LEVIWGAPVLPINKDQYWYIDTANTIASELADNIVNVDYSGIVGLHNRLYNVLAGWLTYLNGGNSIMVIRSFNVFCSAAIIIIGYFLVRELYPEEADYQSMTIVALGLLPSINLYSALILREILIALLVTLFFYFIVTNKKLMSLLILLATYYLRRAISYIMIVIFLLSGLQKNRRLSLVRVIILTSATILLSYAATHLFPVISYTRAYFQIGVIVRFFLSFFTSFLSLDFIFTDTAREISTNQMLLLKMMTPEVFFLPILTLFKVFKRKQLMGEKEQELLFLVLIFIVMFSFGYFMEYGAVQTRFYIPIYPLLLVINVPQLHSMFVNLGIL